jgi:hypothetical protein
MAGVHAALLATGQVLFFSYDPAHENTLELGFWQLWDPATGPVSEEANIHPRNFFCAGRTSSRCDPLHRPRRATTGYGRL